MSLKRKSPKPSSSNTKKQKTGVCRECHVPIINDKTSLSSVGQYGRCLGCSRLKALWRDENEEANGVRWLLGGTLGEEVILHTAIDAKVKRVSHIIKQRCRSMIKNEDNRRSREGIAPIKNEVLEATPTSECLKKLCYESRFRCVVTGQICTCPTNTTKDYKTLSLKYISPVSCEPSKEQSWSIDNIRVMSHAMSQVRGDYSDREVCRWFRLWKKANQ